LEISMKPKRIVRRKEAQKRLGCGRSKWIEDYELHDPDDPYVPGTEIERLRPIPLGPRNIGFVEGEIDGLIDALVAARDAAPLAAPRPAVPRAAVMRSAQVRRQKMIRELTEEARGGRDPPRRDRKKSEPRAPP
jgi:predicted DNA-binding transcriptional regulator AlpA